MQHWINEELELKGSLALAEHTLKGLMDDRGTLTSQLKNLKAKDPNDPNIKILQEDIQLRNAQISDLQQKILAGNQGVLSKYIFLFYYVQIFKFEKYIDWLCE